MSTRYTVQQLATLSGVSVRTLHHYDQIGLLVPAFLGENGYRYYREPELLRLQQILFHREFGIPLKEIAALLDQPDAERVAGLARHKARLEAEAARYRLLIRTIDRTIASLTGECSMPHKELYRGFAHAKYEQEAIARYGKDEVARSSAKFKGLSAQQRADKLAELAELEAGIAACQRAATALDAPELDALLTRHRDWVAFMWDRPCTPAAYAGLATLYREAPDFRARYETLSPGLADYLGAAMQAYAARSA